MKIVTDKKYIASVFLENVNLDKNYIIISNGDLYDYYKDFFIEKGYDVKVLNLKNPKMSDSFNIFEIPYNLYKNGNKKGAISKLRDIYDGLITFEDKDISLDLLTGITLKLFEDADFSEINLLSIYKIICNFQNPSNFKTFKKYFVGNKDLLSNNIVFASSLNKENIIDKPLSLDYIDLSSTLDKIRRCLDVYVLRNDFLSMFSFDKLKEKTVIFIIYDSLNKEKNNIIKSIINLLKYDLMVDNMDLFDFDLPDNYIIGTYDKSKWNYESGSEVLTGNISKLPNLKIKEIKVFDIFEKMNGGF